MANNPESILDSVKKLLGFDASYTAFDLDIIMLINAVFGSLQEMGAGPDTALTISDNTILWSAFSDLPEFLGLVQMYVFLSVKMAFDPPTGRFGLDAMEKMIAQYEWRINIKAEQNNPPSDPPIATKPIFSSPSPW